MIFPLSSENCCSATERQEKTLYFGNYALNLEQLKEIILHFNVKLEGGVL